MTRKHVRFAACNIPRSPMARAHRTVKRPQETNQRMKLTIEKGEGKMSKNLNNYYKSYSEIWFMLLSTYTENIKMKRSSHNSITSSEYKNKHPSRPATNKNCSFS